MALILRTSRLTLRWVERHHASFILELMNEPAYLQNIGDRGVRTLADAVAYIDAKYTANYLSLGFGLYLVEECMARVPVGICGLVKRENLDRPDVGFAFLERYRSLGYGYESAAAVLDYARDTLHLEAVYAIISTRNLPSIGLIEKLGFKLNREVLLPTQSEPSLLFAKDLVAPSRC